MSLCGGPAKPVQTYTPEPEEPAVERAELPSPRANTLITKGITVSGSIQGHGVIQVEGTIEGEVVLDGAVIVASTGLIKGPVQADTIRIAGHVEGNVVARDHLKLENTGVITGDLTTGSLIIEDGGCLNGRTTMAPKKSSQTEDASKPKAVAAAAAGDELDLDRDLDSDLF